MNKLSPLSFSQSEYLYKTFNSWLNVAEGGKRGGKNILNTLAFALNLEKHPDKIHFIGGVNIAAAKINVIDCNGLGLSNYFEGRCREGEYKKRDAFFVKTNLGEKIIVISGLGKDGDEKKIKGNTYGMAYITEVNECHPNSVDEVFDRTLSSNNRKIFHDLNPKAERHFYYRDILDLHQERNAQNPNYGLNYGHFTIADNLSMSQAQVTEVLSKYDKKSIWYQRDILGLRRQLEGLVYPNYDNTISISDLPKSYNQYYVSMDYGIQNPTAMILWGQNNNVWYAIKEYYHSGRDAKDQKTDQEYYDQLLNLIGDLKIRSLIIDPSASSFITLVRKKGKISVTTANNAVLDGIRRTETALQNRNILFSEACKNTIEEFGIYSWNLNSIEDEPVKEFDHAMDAIRYFVKTLNIGLPPRKSLLERRF